MTPFGQSGRFREAEKHIAERLQRAEISSKISVLQGHLILVKILGEEPTEEIVKMYNEIFEEWCKVFSICWL